MSTPLAPTYPSSTVSSALPDERAPASASAGPPRAPRFQDWIREPLLHFVLLGGVLFGIDRMIASKADDPHRIVISAEVEKQTIGTFEAARGRKPNAEELEALHENWLDNEVLYREGLALGVDKGDPAIRERVIFKALSVVDSGVKLPAADDKVLRAWFEAHRDKYDEPMRFDFDEAALAGENPEAAVRAFAGELNAGTPGDSKAGLRVFKSRPKQNLVESYGAPFVRALSAAQPGAWQALETREGWRAIRMNFITPAKPADFQMLKGVILHDWKDQIASEQRTSAVRALTKKYTIQFETAPKGSAK